MGAQMCRVSAMVDGFQASNVAGSCARVSGPGVSGNTFEFNKYSAGRRVVSGGAQTAHTTAGESKGIDELHEVPVSVFSVTGTAGTAATAGESKGIVGLHEANESDFSKADAAVEAATAGESERIIRLHEVSHSAFPPLSNSSHNSCLRLSTFHVHARLVLLVLVLLLLVFALFHRLLRVLLLYMRMPQPCTVHRIRGRTRVG